MSTKDIIEDFVFITYTKEFTYLGSVISSDLDDYSDISLRIKNLTKLWELILFGNSEHVDISAKIQIYLAIPINLLLWGC